MYGKPVPGVAAGTLPFTGLIFGWKVVAATTLVFAGLALLRLMPKREGLTCGPGAAAGEPRGH